MFNEKIVRRMYFAQTAEYYSAGKDEMVKISTMAPRYAANAANKMLDDCFTWADEAGITTDHPALWIATTPLFQALATRGMSAARRS